MFGGGSGETDLLPSQQGIVVLGTPLGDPRFHPSTSGEEGGTLLERIPMVTDLQSAWLILLHCASARANHLLRVLEPQSVAACARAHDEGVLDFHVRPPEHQHQARRRHQELCESAVGVGRSGPQERHTVSRVLGKLGRLFFAHDVRQTP